MIKPRIVTREESRRDNIDASGVRFDSLDSARGARSFVFSRQVDEAVAHTVGEVVPALRRVLRLVERGAFAAGFIAYEAAPAFDPALDAGAARNGLPLVWFGVFQERHEVEPLGFMAEPHADYELGIPNPSLGFEPYAQSVRQIQELIADGDTYQVNFTFRLRAPFAGSASALYRDLVRAQQSAFCAYLPLERHTIVSASPELFFRYSGRQVELRPMKGTRPRGRWSEEDDALAQELAGSSKDRAENLMIVDLLRNDLGRIAEFGSVRVPSLFEVERYPTVHQLTSTVIGTLGQDRDALDLLGALFPSGSVTGAPKIRTSQIIRQLEGESRGPYTGAIGYMGPDEGAFSVAIRTVLVDHLTGIAELGVGSGVTSDSSARDEYQECLGKGAFLQFRRPEFQLLESLRLERPGGYALLDEHMERLRRSAVYFGFQVNLETARNRLLSLCEELAEPGVYKVRLLVDRAGEMRVRWEAIRPDPEDVVLHVAAEPIDERDPLLFHKTTHRRTYQEAMRDIPDGEDVVLRNRRGELTESSRANLVLRMGERLLTPPIASGLLPGTLRGTLLEEGQIQEAVLTTEDLYRASEIYLINSVRGWRRGRLAPQVARHSPPSAE